MTIKPNGPYHQFSEFSICSFSQKTPRISCRVSWSKEEVLFSAAKFQSGLVTRRQVWLQWLKHPILDLPNPDQRSLGPANSQNFAKICIRCDIQIPKLYQQNSDLLTKFELGTVTRIEQDRGWKFHCWLCSTCFIVAWTQNILIHCHVKLRILVRDRNYPCVSPYQFTNLPYFNQTKLLETYTHFNLFEQNLLWMVQATSSEFSKHISDVVDKGTVFVSQSVEEDERNVQ